MDRRIRCIAAAEIRQANFLLKKKKQKNIIIHSNLIEEFVEMKMMCVTRTSGGRRCGLRKTALRCVVLWRAGATNPPESSVKCHGFELVRYAFSIRRDEDEDEDEGEGEGSLESDSSDA